VGARLRRPSRRTGGEVRVRPSPVTPTP
jgi:hypothetical protein